MDSKEKLKEMEAMEAECVTEQPGTVRYDIGHTDYGDTDVGDKIFNKIRKSTRTNFSGTICS